MQVRTVRKPGAPGTQKLVDQYANRLVCVRYRYDPKRHKRYKTVELIIDQEDWTPPEATALHSEKELQRQIKAIGGTWNASQRLWYAPEEHVRRIGLTKRIVR